MANDSSHWLAGKNYQHTTSNKPKIPIKQLIRSIVTHTYCFGFRVLKTNIPVAQVHRGTVYGQSHEMESGQSQTWVNPLAWLELSVLAGPAVPVMNVLHMTERGQPNSNGQLAIACSHHYSMVYVHDNGV